MFGFRLFKQLFFTKCGTKTEAFNFSLIFRLIAVNLESVVICNIATVGFNPSIPLNGHLIDSLLKGLDIVSASYRLSKQLKEVVIIEPADEIGAFIEQYGDSVQNKGFKMEKGKYVHAKRGVESKNCVRIIPM